MSKPKRSRNSRSREVDDLRAEPPKPVRDGSPAELLNWLLYHRENAAKDLLQDFGLPVDSRPGSLPDVPVSRRIDVRMAYAVLDNVRAVRDALARGDAAGVGLAMHLLERAAVQADLGHDLEKLSRERERRRRQSSPAAKARAKKYAEGEYAEQDREIVSQARQSISRAVRLGKPIPHLEDVAEEIAPLDPRKRKAHTIYERVLLPALGPRSRVPQAK